MHKTQWDIGILLAVLVVSVFLIQKPFPGSLAAFLVGGASCLAILTITSRKLDELKKLQRETTENAGFIIGLKRLPAGTYEVMGTISHKTDGSSYGYVIRNIRTDWRYCVSHHHELPDAFVVGPDERIYNGSRRSREKDSLEGVIG